MADHPHILFITTDQQRADTLACYGMAEAQTPNLDALAAEGVVFNRAYCTNVVCTPSRAAMLTGRYPNVTGAWNIGVSVNEDEFTLCDHLRPLGYRNVACGKMHFRPQCADHDGEPEDVAMRDRGRASDGSYFGFHDHHLCEDNGFGPYMDWLREVAPEHVERRGAPKGNTDHSWVNEMPVELHHTRWVGDRAVAAIEQHVPARPLFLWASFVDPHHPFNPPAEFAARFEDMEAAPCIERAGEHDLRPDHLRRQGARGYWPGGGGEHSQHGEMDRIRRHYQAMIAFIDDEVGRILQALQDKGMRDDTIVVFTSDHGEYLGDHGLLYKGPWFYECLARVPLIVHGRGRIEAGRTVDGLVENVDLLPTLMDLIGVESHSGVQGVSQVPVIRGEVASVKDSAITSYDAHDRGIHGKCLITEQYKLTVFTGESYGELFDLHEDPDELHNRFFDEAYAAVKADLFQHFTHRLIADQDPSPERKACW
jgi:arylsulfatase A-like enzyme